MRGQNSSLAILLLILGLLFLVIVVAVFVYVVHQDRVSQQSSGNSPAAAPMLNERRTYAESRQEQRLESSRTRQPAKSCPALGVVCTSDYFQPWQEPADGSCHASMRNGYPVPDPRCTPGGANPTVTVEVMRAPGWRTRCIRDCEESESAKHLAYSWYEIPKPQHNSGANQVCELDHLVPLELGGADGMGNIWPECGPDETVLQDRYFKIKDRVENYLADEVKAGRMPLDEAQRGIASDWTQYLPDANHYCASKGRC